MLRAILIMMCVALPAAAARGQGDDPYGFVTGLIAARLNAPHDADVAGVEVLTAEDLRRMVELEDSRQLAGCEDESGCLAEIGNAMNANLVVYGTVDDLGSTLLLQVTLLDTKTGAIRRRVVERAGSVEDLARAATQVGDTLRTTIGGDVPQRVLVFDIKPRRNASEASASAPATNTWPWVGVAVAVVGAGVAGAGGALDFQSVSLASATNDDATLSAGQARDRRGESDLYALGAGVSYVVGAVLVVGGVTTALISLGAE
jgi:hypothetical protein